MKVLIVDDHAMVREGVAVLLQKHDPAMHIVYAKDGAQACDIAAAEDALDAVILDLVMPGMDGLDVIARLAQQRDDLPIVVLSSSEDPQNIRAALRAGASGYIPKSANGDMLWAAFQFVMSGHVYVPPLLFEAAEDGAARSVEAQTQAALARLTSRQTAVLRLLVTGATNKQIALALGLSEKTVKIHVSGIFKSLDVVNRRQAAGLARPFFPEN
jgi:two-component system, NarL family, nitrate/nitrite response regulator NarL